jgi:16S rRNA (adenine1518-N6/adenine1519-N6)-dimethyltransferase
MNLSQLRRALEQAQVRPVKTMGQNFLHDQNLARWIVDQARIEPSDFVLEIGPGLGALSAEILQRGARLLALEKDKRLVDFLRQHFPQPNFEVQHGDALQYDTRALFAERNVKVLGNVPYYVAGPLLERFLQFPSPISLLLFSLQNELARRLSASPRTCDYGALTLRVQLHHRVEYLRKIPSSVFFPVPEVDSAIVRVTPRQEESLEIFDNELFQEFVRTGFSQRRKQLRKLLGDRVRDWETTAEKIGAALPARAEELSREQWIALANLLAKSGEKSASAAAAEFFPVVDEHNHEIRQATRAEVHANNLRHRAVHILVFSSAGEVLLQQRSAWKDRHPLLWDSSAAGHVEGSESYEDTAGRELKEELGICATLELIGKVAASEKTGQEFIALYRGTHDGPFHFPCDEITALKFFRAGIVDRWIANKPEDFAPGFLECWKLLPEHRRGTPVAVAFR